MRRALEPFAHEPYPFPGVVAAVPGAEPRPIVLSQLRCGALVMSALATPQGSARIDAARTSTRLDATRLTATGHALVGPGDTVTVEESFF